MLSIINHGNDAMISIRKGQDKMKGLSRMNNGRDFTNFLKPEYANIAKVSFCGNGSPIPTHRKLRAETMSSKVISSVLNQGNEIQFKILLQGPDLVKLIQTRSIPTVPPNHINVQIHEKKTTKNKSQIEKKKKKKEKGRVFFGFLHRVFLLLRTNLVFRTFRAYQGASDVLYLLVCHCW